MRKKIGPEISGNHEPLILKRNIFPEIINILALID